MSLMVYSCEECKSEFSMDERLIEDPEEIVCPVCREEGTVAPIVEDDDDEEDLPSRSRGKR